MYAGGELGVAGVRGGAVLAPVLRAVCDAFLFLHHFLQKSMSATAQQSNSAAITLNMIAIVLTNDTSVREIYLLVS